MKPSMLITDLLEETYLALSANKVRSFLTVLGIVIGIASVIAMVALGHGAQKSIQSSIEGLGSNLLTVLPGVVQPGRGVVSAGRGSAQTLKSEDIPVLQALNGVAAVSPELSRRFQVASPTGNNTNTTVTGAWPEYLTVHNLSVADGSFLTESSRSLGREAVLGATVVQDLFADQDPVGKTIRINQALFQVVGVLSAKGGAGFSGPDDMIFVPLSTMQKILTGSESLSTVSISVQDKKQMNDIKQAATDALIIKHRVSEADFSIVSQEDILSALSTVVGTFTLFLAAVAAISLVVGGIGIMNMMLTTVTERTREIGLRKAIGAQEGDIRVQFLMEAVALTFLGGAIGILLGWFLASAISRLAFLPAVVSLSSVLLAVSVSTGIGLVFGYYPARRASRLNPIDALRHE